MPWSASTIYAQAVPRLREALLADPILGPHLHHLRRLRHDAWPTPDRRHDLPPGGLLAIPAVFAPGDRHQPVLPWDALHGPPQLRLGFPDPDVFGAHLHRRAWPPPAALRHLKDLARRTGEPLSWYVCEMHGGEIEHEAAWIPGWRPGEPDRVLCHAAGLGVLVSAGGRPRAEPGDVLRLTLEYHRLRLPSSFFLPHTSTFDWHAHRVGGPAPRRTDRDRQPPHPASLYACVAHGDLERARQLLGAGADPNAYADTTPLELAAGAGRLDLLDLLLAHGADPRPPGGPTALHAAADVACAERLLAAGVPVDGGSAGHTPLICAADRGDDAVARLLVARGAALRPPAHPDGVWFAACRGGLVWLIEALLAAGVDPHAREYGYTEGLELAAARGRVAVFDRLLAAGCDLSERTWLGACRGGSVALIDHHLARGFDANASESGWTALGLALRERHVDAAVRLLAAGADPTRPCHRQTPLHVAASHDLPAAIDAILARCRDPAAAVAARDPHGWTPLFDAVWTGHAASAARLLAHGAAADIVDGAGRRLRDIAAERGVPLA